MCGTKEDASGGIVYVYVNDENKSCKTFKWDDRRNALWQD